MCPGMDTGMGSSCDSAQKLCEAEMSMQRHLHFRCRCLLLCVGSDITKLCLRLGLLFQGAQPADVNTKWKQMAPVVIVFALVVLLVAALPEAHTKLRL
ncbi:hypothetical protein ACLKA7_015562 [Drosophila subpalustris]